VRHRALTQYFGAICNAVLLSTSGGQRRSARSTFVEADLAVREGTSRDRDRGQPAALGGFKMAQEQMSALFVGPSTDGGSLRDGHNGGRTMASRSALITGRVFESGGQPIQGARVLFVNAPEPVPDIAALTDASGCFTLAAPWAGAYTVQVAADGFRSQQVNVTLGAGEKSELSIELRP
jgi:hypothetical protein